MGSLFRSEEMRLCQLFLQTEAAYACVSELGELGLVQFKDLNDEVNAFQRKFVSEVRRCEEMERKLRYMEKELLKDEIKIDDFGEPPPNAPAPKEMIDLEATFEKIDNELREVNTNHEALKQNFLELSELREVLHKTQFYFAMYGQDIQHMIDEESGAHEEAIVSSRGQGAQLGFVVGTIDQKKALMFERVMKYYTHANVFMRTEQIAQHLEDPVTGEVLQKHMFIIFYQGEQLRTKVKKVCDGLRCNVYPVPDAPQERDAMTVGVTTRLNDLDSVLKTTFQHRQRILENVQREVRSWTIKVEKIKAIFHTLNLFKSSQNSLIAECWCPVRALDDIRDCLSRGEKLSGSTIPTIIQPMATGDTPPTYYNCNKFVKGFQAIVDAYGVSTYGEVNPAPYTCITFPFLFAVMFGDAGHGFIMFLFGAWMCIKERSLGAKKSSNEIWNTFFSGRYIIMMMGLFSIYTGLIYNDAFSRSMNIFGSQWEPQVNITGDDDIELNPNTAHINGTAYFMGVDPIWQSAKNKISFLNSLKMKIALTLGVTHMLFGICLSVFNHIHFSKVWLIFLQFIPEMLFLGCLFGYLVAVVIYKWFSFDATTSKCAPPLLIHYINLFMFKYTEDDSDCENKNPEAVFYEGQKITQIVMLLLAVLSVPVLLILRPIVQVALMKSAHKRSFGYHTPHDALISNEVPPAMPNTSDKTKRVPALRGSGLEMGPSQHLNILGQEEDIPDVSVSLNSDEESRTVLHSSYQNEEGDAYNTDYTAPLIPNSPRKGTVVFGGQFENVPKVETESAQTPKTTDLEMGRVNPAFQDENGGVGHMDPELAGAAPVPHEEEEKEDLGELVIENVIETIEFCLGCISHTASYLRLWALSLAHAQLSEVLWTMVMHMGFAIGGQYIGGVILFVIFFFWANLTVGILLLMEGLSAFLHTLRLHWVEFQSKFYKGEGYHFSPFSFKHINEMESLEEMM